MSAIPISPQFPHKVGVPEIPTHVRFQTSNQNDDVQPPSATPPSSPSRHISSPVLAHPAKRIPSRSAVEKDEDLPEHYQKLLLKRTSVRHMEPRVQPVGIMGPPVAVEKTKSLSKIPSVPVPPPGSVPWVRSTVITEKDRDALAEVPVSPRKGQVSPRDGVAHDHSSGRPLVFRPTCEACCASMPEVHLPRMKKLGSLRKTSPTLCKYQRLLTKAERVKYSTQPEKLQKLLKDRATERIRQFVKMAIAVRRFHKAIAAVHMFQKYARGFLARRHFAETTIPCVCNLRLVGERAEGERLQVEAECTNCVLDDCIIEWVDTKNPNTTLARGSSLLLTLPLVGKNLRCTVTPINPRRRRYKVAPVSTETGEISAGLPEISDLRIISGDSRTTHLSLFSVVGNYSGGHEGFSIIEWWVEKEGVRRLVSRSTRQYQACLEDAGSELQVMYTPVRGDDQTGKTQTASIPIQFDERVESMLTKLRSASTPKFNVKINNVTETEAVVVFYEKKLKLQRQGRQLSTISSLAPGGVAVNQRMKFPYPSAKIVAHAYVNTDLLLTFNDTHAPLQLTAESDVHRDAVLLLLRERQTQTTSQ